MASLSSLLASCRPEGARVGFFGGSFNPVHEGHLELARYARKKLDLAKIFFLLSPQNPLKKSKDTLPYGERLSLLQARLTRPFWVASDLENQLGTTKTADFLGFISPFLRRNACVWLMGADSFSSLHHWYHWQRVVSALPLAVFDRPGAHTKLFHTPVGMSLQRSFVPAEKAQRGLLSAKLPAWSFFSMPLRFESSTALREKEHAHRKRNDHNVSL